MGRTVVRTVKVHHEVIEWADINLSATPTGILWQAFNCTPTGDARIAIRSELVNRGEL